MSFEGFSDATRLYAENFAVVEAMRLAFETSVDEFLNAVTERVQEMVDSPQSLQTKQTKGYYYWWLGEDRVGKEVCPQLLTNARVAEIVTPGRMRLTAIAHGANVQDCTRFASAATDERIASSCRPGKGGTWSLFEADIEYSQHDPVEFAAQKIAEILLVLDGLQQSI